MPALFPPISFLRTHTLEGPYFSEPKVSFNQASLFPAITPEKFGRQLKTIRLPFGNKGLFSSMLGIQLVDSYFPDGSKSVNIGEGWSPFSIRIFWGNHLDLLRHKRCFFFFFSHGNRTNWYTLHLARCKMHICRWPKNGSHHFCLLLHKLNQQSKPSNFTRNKLNKSCFLFFFANVMFIPSLPPVAVIFFARMEQFSRDAKAVRAWMQTQAITEAWLHGLSTINGIIGNTVNTYCIYIYVHDILCWEQSHIPRWDMFVRLRVYSYVVFLWFNEPGARNRQDLQNLRPPNIRKTFPSLLTGSLWRHSFYFGVNGDG